MQMAKPDQEDFDKTAAETAAALNLVVNNKIAAAQPKTLPAAPGAPQYIKYTPSQQGPQYNSGASHRIIRMQARYTSSVLHKNSGDCESLQLSYRGAASQACSDDVEGPTPRAASFAPLACLGGVVKQPVAAALPAGAS